MLLNLLKKLFYGQPATVITKPVIITVPIAKEHNLSKLIKKCTSKGDKQEYQYSVHVKDDANVERHLILTQRELDSAILRGEKITTKV